MTKQEKYTISIEQNVAREDMESLGGELGRFNTARVGYDDYAPLILFARDESQNIIGGFIGATYWQWLYVELLLVREQYRGQGYGQELLTAAEQEAKKRGCLHAFLDTFSFQAPEFYKQQGYEVFGQLSNFPPGHNRYWLQKQL